MESLKRALQLAMPEGYVRIFVDEGTPMLRLVSDAVTTGSLASGVQVYANTILHVLEARECEAAPSPDASVTATTRHDTGNEPLTGRELEVLQLLASGQSNQAIADQLIIAVGTVKRHVNSIMGKLQVQSRLEAVARAREPRLL